jgi:hypothetical protein
MAAKEYKITLPGGKVVRTMANSAQQAAKRAEKQSKTGYVVNQRDLISNVTRKQKPGIPAKEKLVGKLASEGLFRRTTGSGGARSPAQKAALKKAQQASAAKRRRR